MKALEGKRKFLVILITVLFALTLAACGVDIPSGCVQVISLALGLFMIGNAAEHLAQKGRDGQGFQLRPKAKSEDGQSTD